MPPKVKIIIVVIAIFLSQIAQSSKVRAGDASPGDNNIPEKLLHAWRTETPGSARFGTLYYIFGREGGFESLIRLGDFGVIRINGNYKVHKNNRILLTKQIGQWAFKPQSLTENVSFEDKEMKFHFAQDGTLRLQEIAQDGTGIGHELIFFRVPPGGLDFRRRYFK
jgi:hypothetical protein